MLTRPPIRIRLNAGAQPSLGSAPATKGPVKPPKPPVPVPTAAPDQPAAAPKPKGPAQTPPKPRPLPVKVEYPQRLQSRSKEARKIPGIFVGGRRWGCPFRVREIDGRWCVVWAGEPWLTKPADWQDIPCGSRPEATQFAQEAFRDWLTSKPLADVLDHARRILRGYNLVCLCPLGYPCHATVLLELANRAENES